jgi:ceramide glucosyltransferase
VVLISVFGFLAMLSLVIQVWQFAAGVRFPMHRRHSPPPGLPGVCILKPLKGCDDHTVDCLRSWLEQTYPGPLQVLFGVNDPADPVCDVVKSLVSTFPNIQAELIICPEVLGPNAKVSTLVQLRRRVAHPVVVVSDADVKIPAGFLAEFIAPLRDPSIGLVNSFYRLANPMNWAMRWEAVATNADFWSQVLQSISLKPQDFALGAAMAFRMEDLRAIGGFEGLVDHLADDYQLGRRIAGLGKRIALSTVTVECWDAPAGWCSVWAHQVRWNRTIRVCQPGPYFASILSNLTVWTLLWALICQSVTAGIIAMTVLAMRGAMAGFLDGRLAGLSFRLKDVLATGALAPMKDILGFAVWVAAFFGNQIIWRGMTYRVKPDGRMTLESRIDEEMTT